MSRHTRRCNACEETPCCGKAAGCSPSGYDEAPWWVSPVLAHGFDVTWCTPDDWYEAMAVLMAERSPA